MCEPTRKLHSPRKFLVQFAFLIGCIFHGPSHNENRITLKKNLACKEFVSARPALLRLRIGSSQEILGYNEVLRTRNRRNDGRSARPKEFIEPSQDGFSDEGQSPPERT